MGRKPAGIRLDSGDLAKDSRWVRRELDRAGWNDVKIFASGDLDEYTIAALIAKGAAIDAFGVGTALATPGDAPHLNLIYKLVEVERDGKVREAAKLSRAKVTYPGRKQVFRYSSRPENFASDRIALENEPAEWRRAASRGSNARRPSRCPARTSLRFARALPRRPGAPPESLSPDQSRRDVSRALHQTTRSAARKGSPPHSPLCAKIAASRPSHDYEATCQNCRQREHCSLLLGVALGRAEMLQLLPEAETLRSRR